MRFLKHVFFVLVRRESVAVVVLSLVILYAPLEARAFSLAGVTAQVTSAIGCFVRGIFGSGCETVEVATQPFEIPQVPPEASESSVSNSVTDSVSAQDPEDAVALAALREDFTDLQHEVVALWGVREQSAGLNVAEVGQGFDISLMEDLLRKAVLQTQVARTLDTEAHTTADLEALSARVDRAFSLLRAGSTNVHIARDDISDRGYIDSLERVTITDPIISDPTLSGEASLERLSVSGTAAFMGSVLYIDASTNRVGVGTTTPQEALSVAGAIYLDEHVPVSGVNLLYNSGGDLYWGGSLLVASTTGTWTGLAGSVYRLTGNVGIGTSSPNAKLEVAGTLVAGTTTAPLIDAGGTVCNVQAYGAVGDNATDNYDAIVRAIADCPMGGTVYFPMGVYRIRQTLVLDKPVTLKGSYAPRWSYSSSPRTSIKPTPTFTGTSIIHVRDKSLSGEANDNNGGRIIGLSIDGNSYGVDVDGMYFEGLVRDWKVEQVDISQTSGNGFHASEGAGSGNPRGFTVMGLSVYSPNKHGFRATALNDSYIEDVLVVGGAQRGFYLSSMGETKLVGSRAVFNALEGLYIDGQTNNGGLQIADFSTDRNGRHGVRISAYGTTTIAINGLLTRRDGSVVVGGEAPYAGVAIMGTVTDKVAPVIITNLTQIIGVNDGGGGAISPSVGVRAEYSSYVNVDGVLWGTDDAYVDSGNNDAFIIKENALLRTGNVGTLTEARFNNGWIVASTTLSYVSGSVGVGTNTPARLLHISGVTSAATRVTDTTNMVNTELRADDFQGFVGTMSNHDFRVMTNGLSRLSVTASGNVGVGTTTPGYLLHVARAGDGAVAAFTDANGTCTIDPTNTALVCSSDRDLKKNIVTIPDALDRLVQLRGVNFQWKEQGDEDSQRFGFIAQEVESVFPEFVMQDSNKHKMVNTLGFTPVLVESIKALNLKVRDLEARQVPVQGAGITTSFTETLRYILEQLEAFGVIVRDGLLQVRRLVVDDELCIGDTCVNEEELTALLETLSTAANDPQPETTSQENVESVSTMVDDVMVLPAATDTVTEDVINEFQSTGESDLNTDLTKEEY